MAQVVIVGGGVSGLVASYVCAQAGHKAIILEPHALGGDFLKGGLKYVHRTPAMVRLFDDLGVPHSDYAVRGGILLRGEVRPYPKCLQKVSKQEAERIQADHFRKTRRTEPGRFGAKAMNDPAAQRLSRRAIRCDFAEFIKALGARAEIRKRSVQAISSVESRLLLDDGSWLPYERLISTLPLWVVREMCDFYVPQGMAMSLNLIQVSPLRDRFAKWDYVYTPYTPGDAVHRLSPRDSGYSVEANGDWERIERKVLDDLAFLFPDGFAIDGVAKGVKGHLLDLQEQPAWPANVHPLGRFARWDPRATTDTTLEDAKRLIGSWK